MINVNTIYNLVKQSLGSYQKINVTPSQFNNSVPMAEIALMNELLGNNTNNPNISRSRQFYLSVSDSSNEQLKPFIKEEMFEPINSGHFNVDSNKIFHIENVFIRYDDLFVYARYRSVDRFNAEISSEIDKPSQTYPIWTIKDSNVYYAPVVPANTVPKITYVAHPQWDFQTGTIKKTKWAYTGSGADIAYDPVNSIDSRFLDSSLDGLLGHILKYLGVSLKDANVIGFSNQLKNEI